MTSSVYSQCQSSLLRAKAGLDVLHHRKAITEDTVRAIRAKRRTSDVAMQAVFEELRHAFITPIDREDLLRLRQTIEAVVFCIDEVLIALFYQGRPTLHPNDTALLSAVTAEFTALQAVVDFFPDYPRCDAVLGHLKTLEKQHRQCEEERGSNFGEPALKKISAACFSAAETIRCILLKVT